MEVAWALTEGEPLLEIARLPIHLGRLQRRKTITQVPIALKSSSSPNKWATAWNDLWLSFKRKILKKARKPPLIWISTRILAVTSLQWASNRHLAPVLSLPPRNTSRWCFSSQTRVSTRADSFTTVRWRTTRVPYTTVTYSRRADSMIKTNSWLLASRRSSRQIYSLTKSQNKWVAQWCMVSTLNMLSLPSTWINSSFRVLLSGKLLVSSTIIKVWCHLQDYKGLRWQSLPYHRREWWASSTSCSASKGPCAAQVAQNPQSHPIATPRLGVPAKARRRRCPMSLISLSLRWINHWIADSSSHKLKRNHGLFKRC